MSKAVEGAVMLAGAVGMGVAAFFDPALIASPMYDKAMFALAMGGISMEAGAIAGALTSNRGTNITTRQAAAYRQVVYGEQRVGGVDLYESTTGSHHDQYNYVIVVAWHTVDSIVNLYLDGRQVFWAGGTGNVTRNGVNFGGAADSNNHTGPGGQQYNFGGLVYCEANYGDQTNQPNTTPGGGFNTGLQANDPTWAPSAQGIPYVGGCTYFYLKVEYSPEMFPNAPEVRVTVRGKNDIWDPRMQTRGYTNNAALCVADVYSSPKFLMNERVNQAQLIAAANICDEQISYGGAGSGTEARYSLGWHTDTGTAAGDMISAMKEAMGARISRIGGEQYIFPAVWIGPSFQFDQGALAAGFTWNPYREPGKLYNRVQGTYIAPNYPYNATAANGSNLYDSNGFYDGQIQNNFNFAFQPTSFPTYMQDAKHGYPADQFLLSDSGNPQPFVAGQNYNQGDVVTLGGVIFRALQANPGTAPVGGVADFVWEFGSVVQPMELNLSCVLSVSQAQRLAKIALMRNRFQGTGSLTMAPVAYRMQPQDVMEFTMPALGWAGKVLEIGPMRTAYAPDERGVPRMLVQVAIAETGPEVYEWLPQEEQNVYAAQVAPMQSYTPLPPGGPIGLVSLPLIGADGVVQPRIRVSWLQPADYLVRQIELQFRIHAAGAQAGAWMPAGFVSVDSTSALIVAVAAGQTYDVQIRSVRANGAKSAWVEADGFMVGLALSQLSQAALAPGSLQSQAVSGGLANILVNPFTASYGTLQVPILPDGPVVLSGLNQAQRYFVYYADPSFAGGDVTPIATQNPADYLGKPGYFLIDSIVTLYNGSGSTTPGGSTPSSRYPPSAFTDDGDLSTQNPNNASDGDPNTCATVTGITVLQPSAGSNANATAGPTGGGGAQYESSDGEGVWSGFPNVAASSSATLVIVAAVTSSNAGGTVTLQMTGAQTATLATITAATAQTTYSAPIPAGTMLSGLNAQVESVPNGSGRASISAQIAEIYIQN